MKCETYNQKLLVDKLECKHCNMNIQIRNPSGFCDHLYYPNYCKICDNK